MWQEELKKRAEAARERAKMKAQKEEQERASSRAVAGVNHLDIPAELAFILNKLDGEKLLYHFTVKVLIRKVIH